MNTDIFTEEKKENDIYGKYRSNMEFVMNDMEKRLELFDAEIYESSGEHIFEHVNCRIKSEESIREKCKKKDLPVTTESALKVIKDSIGIRIVCAFVDDVYRIIEHIRGMYNCHVVEEKDYITHAKSNGYRSYHMILEVETPLPDCYEQIPGHYYIEVQLRTIAMDTWASLEHKVRYKKDIKSGKMIEDELKRCSDELASCDISMMTIRNLIKE